MKTPNTEMMARLFEEARRDAGNPRHPVLIKPSTNHQAEFEAAWRSAETSEQKVDAIYRYAVAEHKAQVKEKEMLPPGGEEPETAAEIAGRVALQRNLSKIEWTALDRRLEDEGLLRDGYQVEFEAAWRSAETAEERADAVVRYAVAAHAALGFPVSEIAANTTLERSLSREEWRALEERLALDGHLPKQVARLGQKLALYPQVKEYAEHGQARLLRWRAEQARRKQQEAERQRAIQRQYQQRQADAAAKSKEAQWELERPRRLYRLFHPRRFRLQREAALRAIREATEILRQPYEEYAAKNQPKPPEPRAADAGPALPYPRFEAALDPSSLEVVEVEMVSYDRCESISPAEAATNAMLSGAWCRRTEQEFAALPAELKPLLDQTRVEEFEKRNPPEAMVMQGTEAGLEPEAEAEPEPQIVLEEEMELELEM